MKQQNAEQIVKAKYPGKDIGCWSDGSCFKVQMIQGLREHEPYTLGQGATRAEAWADAAARITKGESK